MSSRQRRPRAATRAAARRQRRRRRRRAPAARCPERAEPCSRRRPTADTGLAWLYPYDKTVWPQGLLAPLLQWSGAAGAAALRRHLHPHPGDGLRLPGLLRGQRDAVRQSPNPQAAWDTLSYSNQGEPVTVTLVFSPAGRGLRAAHRDVDHRAGHVDRAPSTTTRTARAWPPTTARRQGPRAPSASAARRWHQARRDQPGARRGDATSAPGTRAAAASATRCGAGRDAGHAARRELRPVELLRARRTPTPRRHGAPPGRPVRVPGRLARRHVPPHQRGPLPGTAPAATQRPVLDPVGHSHHVHGLARGPGGRGRRCSRRTTSTSRSTTTDGRQLSLASMDFDAGHEHVLEQADARHPTGGVHRPVPRVPADQRLRHLRARGQFDGASGRHEFGATAPCANGAGRHGELWWVDLATKTATPLAELKNLNGGGVPADDVRHPTTRPTRRCSYEPTVNPVASGGYAWVVFTSRRLYGNVATHESLAGAIPRNYPNRPLGDAQEALGRGDRPQRHAGHRPEPPGVLPAGAGAARRQLARLLGS